MIDTRVEAARDLADVLCREVASRVHRYFPDLGSDVTVRALHRGRPLVRKHSVLFELAVIDRAGRTRRGVFIKLPRLGSPSDVQRLYQTLATLHAFATTLPEPLNVVRPLDYLPEYRAVVTERVDGVALSASLRSGGRAERHGELVRQCGRFLRAYHDELGQIASECHLAGTFLERCAVYVKRLERQGVEPRACEHMLAGFERGAKWLDGEVPTCVTFDDFSVRNILVCGDRLFLVEAPVPRRKTIYDDLAAFLNSLTTLHWGTPWFFLGVVPSPALGQQFLAGYFADGIPSERIALFSAKSLCFRWHRALDTLSSRSARASGLLPVRLLAARVNRVFYRSVSGCLERASGTGRDTPPASLRDADLAREIRR